MPLGLGPRFVVEAAFLIAVAVAAGMLSLSTPAIVGVMAGAWLLVAAVEWGLSRRTAARVGSLAAEAARPEARAAPGRVDAPEEPEPLPEPVPPEPVEATAEAPPPEALAERVPPPLPEPAPPAPEPVEEPEPVARPELVAVPAPEPEPEPERQAGPEPAPEVVRLDVRQEPREWNLWDLERAARAVAGDDLASDEERAFLLMYLREFAGPDGSLPASFDTLVRDSFGDLLGSGAR
jgi:hypothetical protein